MTTIKRCWVIISTSFILLGSLLRHRILYRYYYEDRGFFVIFFWRGQRQWRKMPKACSDRSQKNSRCRSSGEAWATWDVGFCRREENRAGRTPRAEGSRHEHGRAEHALRGAKASRRWCDAKTCEGSFRETNVER